MSDNFVTGLTSVALGVLGVATLAVIFSRNADTAQVIKAGGSALSQNIGAAVSPITGGGIGGYTPTSYSSSMA